MPLPSRYVIAPVHVHVKAAFGALRYATDFIEQPSSTSNRLVRQLNASETVIII